MRLLSWFLLSYDGSFAREWINTLLNIPALISVPNHLRLFSLPVLIDASGAQKRWCARLSLTPDVALPSAMFGFCSGKVGNPQNH
jgi:hypothetical protein